MVHPIEGEFKIFTLPLADDISISSISSIVLIGMALKFWLIVPSLFFLPPIFSMGIIILSFDASQINILFPFLLKSSTFLLYNPI